MEIKQLKGGMVIATKRAEEPKKKNMRLGTPGTLFADEATGALLVECAKAKYGIPVVTDVRVIFREIEGTIYLVVSPVWMAAAAEVAAEAPQQGRAGQSVAELPGEVYALKNAPKHPTVYKLAPLVAALKQPLRRDFWYVMESQLVEDEQLGLSVAGDWTNAKLEPREFRTRKGGPKAS